MCSRPRMNHRIASKKSNLIQKGHNFLYFAGTISHWRWISISEETGGIFCETGQREGCTALRSSDKCLNFLFFAGRKKGGKAQYVLPEAVSFHCIIPENRRIKAESTAFLSPKHSQQCQDMRIKNQDGCTSHKMLSNKRPEMMIKSPPSWLCSNCPWCPRKICKAGAWHCGAT